MTTRWLTGKGGRLMGGLLVLAAISLSLRHDLALFHWRQGKERLAAGDHRAALTALDRAAQGSCGKAAVKLDAGVAHYRLGEFRQAHEQFLQASAAPDPELKGAAYYNLGNCAYRLSLQLPESDREGRRRLLQEALRQYEQALALSVGDDARHNLSVVRGRLAAWEGAANGAANGAAGQRPAAPGADPSTSGKDGSGSRGEEGRREGEGERTKRSGEGKESDGVPADDDGATAAAKKAVRLGREQAEQLLNEARGREPSLLPLAARSGHGYSSRPAKDW